MMLGAGCTALHCSRSPCPALNTLANHGLLPRDGKNIDYKMLKSALIDIYGLSGTFGTIFAHAATKKFAVPATGKFSLCDLLINIHSKDQPSGSTGIEHAASLTREDRPTYDHSSDATQRSPQSAQVNIVLNVAGADQIISLPEFVVAREQLWDKSFKARPAMKADKLVLQQKIIANVEGCLLLGAIAGNSNQGKFQISKSYAQSFLMNERFPAGWTKSSRSLGLPELFECLADQGLEWAADEFKALTHLSKNWFGFAMF